MGVVMRVLAAVEAALMRIAPVLKDGGRVMYSMTDRGGKVSGGGDVGAHMLG